MNPTRLDDVTEFPLCWPEAKPRTAQRIGSPFRTSMARAQQEIREEMPRWGALGWTVSMAPQYRSGPIDPAAALWWEHPLDGAPGRDLRVLACDTYTSREANLHAIALTLERLRSVERYGTFSLDQATAGARLALPAPDAPPVDWKRLLGDITAPGLTNAKRLVLAESTYRAMSKEAAGDEDRQLRLNLAIEAARKELAGAEQGEQP